SSTSPPCSSRTSLTKSFLICMTHSPSGERPGRPRVGRPHRSDPIPDQVIGARDRRVNLRMRIVVNGDGVRSITRGGWFARPVMRRVGGKETTESTEDTEQCRRSVRNPKSETSNSNGLFFLCALCVLCALCGQLVFDR